MQDPWPHYCVNTAQVNFSNGMYVGRLAQEISEEREKFIDLLDDVRPIVKVDQPISLLQSKRLFRFALNFVCIAVNKVVHSD